MIALPRFARLGRHARRLAADQSGLALLEFAYTLPLVMAAGGWGVELSNLALTNMRVSQYALNLADTISRLGTDGGAGVTRFREADVNDAFQGVRVQGKAIGIGTNGRVIVSSLENTKQSYDKSGYVQRIHWQRCFGMMKGGAYTTPYATGYESSYGTTPVAAGSTNDSTNAGAVSAGMGDTGYVVTAPKDNAVMFVEINYKYKPLFGSLFVSPRIIHYTASLIVRDNRDLTQIYNPSPAATVSTCDKYTA